MKIPLPIGGIHSGMPNAPARLFMCGGVSAAGCMKVYKRIKATKKPSAVCRRLFYIGKRH